MPLLSPESLPCFLLWDFDEPPEPPLDLGGSSGGTKKRDDEEARPPMATSTVDDAEGRCGVVSL